MKETVYIRQQGKDCVLAQDGSRNIIQDCDANKLANTLWNRLGAKYTSSEMYKYGFIPDTSQKYRYI